MAVEWRKYILQRLKKAWLINLLNRSHRARIQFQQIVFVLYSGSLFSQGVLAL